MRPQRKEPDCHTKAVIAALARFHERGLGNNVFICNEPNVREHMDRARVFLMAKYPVLSPYQMRQVSLGNGKDGQGLGFVISYISSAELIHSPEKLRSLNTHITVLDDAMLEHTLPHGLHQEILALIKITNSRYEG